MLEQKAYGGKRDAVAVETFGGVRPVGVLAPLAAASAEAGDRSDEAVASNRDKIL